MTKIKVLRITVRNPNDLEDAINKRVELYVGNPDNVISINVVNPSSVIMFYKYSFSESSTGTQLVP